MKPGAFSNPVIPGFHPDPSICRADNEFFLVTSSFEYFSCLPIFRSTDLVNWELIGHALDRDEQIDLRATPASKGLYAATIRHHEGRFFIVCTDVGGIGNFVITADRPEGPWSKPVPIPIAGIDPSLFFENGRVWLTVAAPEQRGISLVEVDLATGGLVGEPQFIWRGTGGKYPEGPHIYRRDGWLYLLIAEGGTEFGHMVTVARSREIHGPYEACPHNPILSHRSTDHPLQATGHADLVEIASGETWMVFHCNRPAGYPPMHHLGRETCLAPVTWKRNGWPHVEHPLPLELPAPLPLRTQASDPAVRDDFDGPQLAPFWTFRRNPPAASFSLVRRPGNLSLQCCDGRLDSETPMAWVGRRQQHFDCRVGVSLGFNPLKTGQKAGLAVQMNHAHYAAIVVGLRAGQRMVWLEKVACGLREFAEPVSLEPGPVSLQIVATDTIYQFFAETGGARSRLGELSARLVSTELAGGFTGVFFAMFASGGDASAEAWADFDWFDYEGRTSANDQNRVPSQTGPFWKDRMFTAGEKPLT